MKLISILCPAILGCGAALADTWPAIDLVPICSAFHNTAYLEVIFSGTPNLPMSCSSRLMTYNQASGSFTQCNNNYFSFSFDTSGGYQTSFSQYGDCAGNAFTLNTSALWEVVCSFYPGSSVPEVVRNLTALDACT